MLVWRNLGEKGAYQYTEQSLTLTASPIATVIYVMTAIVEIAGRTAVVIAALQITMENLFLTVCAVL